MTGSLQVRPFTTLDTERWTSFITQCPNATFFHRIEWRSILEDVFRHRTHYLVAERGGEIVGVLPLAQVKSRLFGHALVSLPFAVQAGIATMEPEAGDALRAMAVELARALGVEHLELRHGEAQAPAWPRQDLYVTFRKDLKPDVEANLLAIPRKQRAMVRKGQGFGLTSEIDRDASRFFALYADNMQRHGTPPMSRAYFEALLKAFGSDCDVLTVLDKTGRPVSAVLSFYFRGDCMPYYAGDLADARDLAANDFKYWELMRRACERGCTGFDYGRSKKGTGAYDFKKNWGFEPVQFNYEYALFKRDAIPQNNPNNPKYRALIALWRRLPRPVVNAIGPSIVRHLG
ncbi:MAG TPA: FemAB family XrtA/PEP-CTERM system-associated protein [Burkholderiaceae bacterium]|nr:FemAB family XrtA/PEP-CTERM system-associated protein [Burkholderiaceae bacterium]